MSDSPDASIHERVLALLDAADADYTLIHHEPEGRTEVISEIRGNPPAQAAKCIVVRVQVSKKSSSYKLVVVGGDRRVDLDRVAQLSGGSRAAFAQKHVAEEMCGSESGSIVPFSFRSDLQLLVDGDLMQQPCLYFNAGRLDASIRLPTAEYLRIASPWTEQVAERQLEVSQDVH
jgi:Ala-tRNA(Pro) deacylase